MITLQIIYATLFVLTNANTQVPKVESDSLPADSISWDKLLDDVVVVAQKPIVNFSTEKIEYRANEDPASKTQTVLEMLRKVPLVTVDGKNNISVNGSQEFLVYIDGRPSTMVTRNPSKVLRNMPASSVQRIEVITNPGARYDAEGSGGILNIITQKKHKNVQREVSGSSHTTIGTSEWGQNVSLNVVDGRLTVDANLMGEYEYQGHAPVNMITENLKGDKVTEHSSQDFAQHMPFVMAQAEVGYETDSVSQLHLSLEGNYMSMLEKGPSSYMYIGGRYGDGVTLPTDNENEFRMASFDGSVNYQRFWGDKADGSMMFTYQYSLSPVLNRLNHIYEDEESAMSYGFKSMRQNNKERNSNHNAMADFVVPLTGALKLNTGLKYTADVNRSDVFRQHQDIMATYAEAEVRHRWLKAKAGLRHEYTWQRSRFTDDSKQDFEKRYGIFAPSASITATLNDKNSIGFNYNLRIRRPDIEQLDPYVNRYDPLSISYGNPHLDVVKNHSLSLLYMFKSSRFSISATVALGLRNNGIQSYSFISDGIVNNTYGNVCRRRKTSLNVMSSWSMTGSTRVLVNSQVSYVDYNSKQLDARAHGWCFSSNIGVQQSLPWKLKFTSNLEFMTREQTLQGWQSGMAMVTASIARSFANDRWNVALSGSTGLGHGGDIVWKEYKKTRDFIYQESFVMPVQGITLGITYSFGGIKKEKQEDFDLDLPKSKTRKH